MKLAIALLLLLALVAIARPSWAHSNDDDDDDDDDDNGHQFVKVPSYLTVPALATYTPIEPPYNITPSGVPVNRTGYGSDLFVVPARFKGAFALEVLLLRDRGPNADAPKGAKVFPVPKYAPGFGRFAVVSDGTLRRLEDAVFKRPDGVTLLSGLPNPAGFGATGEVALDVAGNVLPTDAYGLDSEGIVQLDDGTYWVSDEYGPHLVHFSAKYVELERVNPFGSGTGGRRLPRVLSTRRVNRGMEGLSVTYEWYPTGAVNQKGPWLVGVMQSTLLNAVEAAAAAALQKTSRNCRIVAFHPASGEVFEYAYVANAVASSLSGISAIAGQPGQFLVIERDGDVPTGLAGDTTVKLVYKIDLSTASNIHDPLDRAHGLLFTGGLTYEQLLPADFSTHLLTPVPKTLVFDLVAAGYTHDKFEGLALWNGKLLAANDDDFGITVDDKNKIIIKKLAKANDSTQLSAYTL